MKSPIQIDPEFKVLFWRRNLRAIFALERLLSIPDHVLASPCNASYCQTAD